MSHKFNFSTIEDPNSPVDLESQEVKKIMLDFGKVK